MTNQPFGSREDVKRMLEERLRFLAKNTAAISEGGGEPDKLVEQVVDVAESIIAFDQVFGTRPTGELIRRALLNAHEEE
jgi:hypothetical protein